MLAYTPEKYRWVGPSDDAKHLERQLVRVRMEPVADNWDPVPVEWIPETIHRPVPDFPQFWAGVMCVSKRAVAALEAYLRKAGEILPLRGLDSEYVGFHCLRTIDAIDQEATDIAVKARKGISFSSPTFVPSLRAERIPSDYDVFRISQSFQKVFVSTRVKASYDSAGLRGLEFLPVPLT
jgi:hypothetical protein